MTGLKTSVHQNTLKGMKTQATEFKKRFATYKASKGLVSRVWKFSSKSPFKKPWITQ